MENFTPVVSQMSHNQSLPESAGDPPQPLLEVAAGDLVWSLQPTGTYVVGRGQSCDLTLNHPTVSRQHFALHFDGVDWVITDLNSTNGLYTEGGKVDSQVIGQQTQVVLGSDEDDLTIFLTSHAADEEEPWYGEPVPPPPLPPELPLPPEPPMMENLPVTPPPPLYPQPDFPLQASAPRSDRPIRPFSVTAAVENQAALDDTTRLALGADEPTLLGTPGNVYSGPSQNANKGPNGDYPGHSGVGDAGDHGRPRTLTSESSKRYVAGRFDSRRPPKGSLAAPSQRP